MKSFEAEIKERFALVERDRSDMHAFQHEDVQFMKDHPFCFVLLDLGLGKTVTAGTVAVDLLRELPPSDDKILIVGPIPLVVTSWPDEFRQWRHLAPFDFTVIREDDKDPRLSAARKRARAAGENESKAETDERRRIREELATAKTSIHLINIEGIEWLAEFYGRKWPYRTVIVDEAGLLKSHQSGRWNTLKRLRISDGYIKRMYLLTATPASESYEAFFPLTFLLDRGDRFGQYITHFRQRYFTQNPYSRKWSLRPGAEEEILAKIADIATVRKRADHFSVQEALVVQRRVILDADQMNLYEGLASEFIITLPDGKEIEAQNAAALSQKLSQLASGVLYSTDIVPDPDADPDDEDARIKVKSVHHIHDHKIEMLRQIVEELEGKNVLVAYQHKSSLDRILKAFPQAKKWDKTGKLKAPWNAGKIPMMVMHPRSGGHGNNLQKGGHHIVFFDIPWSRDQFVQLIGRLDRQGQQHPVTVLLLVAAGTIDERIARAQVTKKMNEEEMFRILKSLIRKYRGG